MTKRKRDYLSTSEMSNVAVLEVDLCSEQHADADCRCLQQGITSDI